MNKRYTYYWHDYMNCQVVVDNKTTEEYPIEDNRVQDSKYDNNGIKYLVNKMNEQDKEITLLTRKLTETIKYSNHLIYLIEDYCEKYYDNMNLQSKIDFGKILKYLGWEEQ